MRFAPLLCAVAVIGCKKPPAEPPGPEPTNLEIISPGAEPRRALRYALPKGTKTTLELAMDIGLTAGTMGGPMPTLVVTFEMSVEDVLPDGGMKLRTTVADVAARDRPDTQVAAAAMTGQIEPLKGIAINAVLAPDGRLADAMIDLGGRTLQPAVTAQLGSLTSSLQQVAMPLPTAPVGVGAKWKSTRTVDQNGMKLTTVSTVDLTAITGDQLSFTLGSELHGPDQTVNQSGTAVEVKHIKGTGEGHGTIDLDKLAVNGELSSELTTDMAAQGQETPMKMTMKISITPK